MMGMVSALRLYLVLGGVCHRISWWPQVLRSRSWPGQCGPDLALTPVYSPSQDLSIVLLTSPLTQTDTR